MDSLYISFDYIQHNIEIIKSHVIINFSLHVHFWFLILR